MELTLTKPLVYLDVEATGKDPATDKIVSFAGLKLVPADMLQGAKEEHLLIVVNPEREMTDEVVGIHGITNAFAKTKLPFKEWAKQIHDFLAGSDLAGFNLINFDVPILWEEFFRCGITWNLEGVRVIDAGVFFKRKEERSLSAAMQFYCNKTHDDAHSADGDVQATREVLSAQLDRYPDLGKMGISELAEYSKMEDRVDLAGKIKMKDGVPVYNIRRVQDVPVEDDPSFAEWMISRDFSQNTKMHLRRILGWDAPPKQGAFFPDDDNE